MNLKLLVFSSTFLFLCNCKVNNRSTEPESLGQVPSTTLPINSAHLDSNFASFVDFFSKDSAFQVSRTKVPLKVKRYDLMADKDTIVYWKRSELRRLDFRNNLEAGKRDWEKAIVVNKNGEKAVVEIRGTENGLNVDYIFEKVKGLWFLVEIDDRST